MSVNRSLMACALILPPLAWTAANALPGITVAGYALFLGMLTAAVWLTRVALRR